jgi:hypothetical protein
MIAPREKSGYAGNVRKRYFTLAEANAQLARVRPRIICMMQLSAHLRSSSEGEQTPTPPGTPWLVDPVVAAWQAQDPEKGRVLAACLYETLSEELKALEQSGIEVKDLSVGMIGFPSLLEGTTEVSLSWKVSEPEVQFFCPAANQRTRRPIEGQSFAAERSPRGQLRE